VSLPSWHDVPIISGRTARRLLEVADGNLIVSLDLGRSQCQVGVDGNQITLPDGTLVARGELAGAFSHPEDCIELRPDGPRKVYLYSEPLRRHYKLYQPFEDRPPTIVINGVSMHAIVGRDPWEDEEGKVAAVQGGRSGECLDTCGGLGYSAQLLAGAGFAPVVSCEVDPHVLAVAAVNPWSKDLFKNSRIELLNADVRQFLAECAGDRFTCIFHDPPTIYQAGELYAEGLYREFARVLEAGGLLYHYVGTPGQRSGRDYARGVIRRLQASGFMRCRRVAGGVVATRSRPL
jgi:predicted methyltransferase